MARVCPYCRKEIPNLPEKPRDLGLLLNVLTYRVPLDTEITEPVIERVRQHCRMKPERLAALRAEPHARFWRSMLQRRLALRAYVRQHGTLPPRGAPLLPGEPDRAAAVEGFRRYRKGGLAKFKARVRKHPDTAETKLTNRYLATKRIRSVTWRNAALNDVLARLNALVGARAGRLTLAQYEDLRALMLRDDALPRRFKRKRDTGMGCGAEGSSENAPGEPGSKVPCPGPPTARQR